MIIGIHKIAKNDVYANKWKEFLNKYSIKSKFLNLFSEKIPEDIKSFDGIMWRWTHNPNYKQSAQKILYVIENYLNIPVFPNNFTAWHYDNKIAQYYLLKTLGAPIPETFVFWNRNEAINWSKTAKYPIVFKLSSGAGSSNVLKVENQSEAKKLIDKMFNRGVFPYSMNEYKKSFIPKTFIDYKKLARRTLDSLRYLVINDYPKLDGTWWKPEHSYIYFQEYLEGNDFDTRINIIGNRAICLRRYNRENDFRASGSGLVDTNPNKINKECIEIAFKISKLGNFQSMAYDFLLKKGSPVISEISYTFLDKTVASCPGHWDSNLNWINGFIYPQEAQVIDFVNNIKKRDR